MQREYRKQVAWVMENVLPRTTPGQAEEPPGHRRKRFLLKIETRFAIRLQWPV